MAAYAVLAVSIYSKVETAKDQKKSNDEIRVQNRLDQRKTDIRNARERVNVVRKARIARAQVLAAAENTGGGSGSGVVGGVSSIGSQVAGNLGFVNQISGIDTSINASRGRQGSALSSAARSQAIGGLADSIFSTALKFDSARRKIPPVKNKKGEK